MTVKRWFSVMFVAMAIPLHAARSAVVIYGEGNSTCGHWSQLRNAQATWATEGAIIVGAWVRGYLTALEVLDVAMKKHEIAQTDSDAIDGWLDNYCKAHPLNNMVNAGFALHNALLDKAHPR